MDEGTDTEADHGDSELVRPEEPVNDPELFGVVHALKELVDREAEGDERGWRPDPCDASIGAAPVRRHGRDGQAAL